MEPVKLDEFSKPAKNLLALNYQTRGFQLKAKQALSCWKATVTSAIDLFPAADSCSTPAKVTWKVPAVLDSGDICVEKFEMDKLGAMVLHTEVKVTEDFALAVKSDFVEVDNLYTGVTYTGLENTMLKTMVGVTKPMEDTSFEATHAHPSGCMFGARFHAVDLLRPEIGFRYHSGRFFGCARVSPLLGTFVGHAYVQPVDNLKCAAMFQHGGVGGGNFSVGAVYDVMEGTSLRAKVQQNMALSCGVKQEVSPGVHVILGGMYGLNTNLSYGVQLSIE